jgi:hypothetical protein
MKLQMLSVTINVNVKRIISNMKKSTQYSITKEIRDFVIKTTKLYTDPIKGIIGYNHLMNPKSSKRSISSDLAYYLLLSDLNIICVELNKYLNCEISQAQLCALISYFHSKHIIPTAANLFNINEGLYKLAGEKLFTDKLEPNGTRGLRRIELHLWSNKVDYIPTTYKLS